MGRVTMDAAQSYPTLITPGVNMQTEPSTTVLVTEGQQGDVLAEEHRVVEHDANQA